MCFYNGLRLSSAQERTTVRCRYMDESHRRNNGKEARHKRLYHMICLYEVQLQANKSRATEVKIAATSAGGYWLAGEEKDF